jgi:excisionase family DNA binding protein
MSSPLLPEDDQPLRIQAMADWLGISPKTIRRRIDSGALKSVKMGGLRVVLRRDFKAFLANLNPSGESHV